MIKINGVVLQQTKGGLTISYETVRSANYGNNQYGVPVGTTLGVRVHITINTNQMTEEEQTTIMLATADQAEGFPITFRHGQEDMTLNFVSEGERGWTYANQKLKKYGSSSLKFMSKELI